MNLAQQLKIKTVKHPLSQKSWETKEAYLKMIVFAINADESKQEELTPAFKNLLTQLECQEFEEDFMEFLSHPDIEEFEKNLQILQKENLYNIYLLDSLFLLYATDATPDQAEFIAFLLEKMNISKEYVDAVTALLNKMQDEDSKSRAEELLALADKYQQSSFIQEFVTFYAFSSSIKTELKEIVGQKMKALLQERLAFSKERSKQSWRYVKKITQLSVAMMKVNDRKARKLEEEQQELEEESQEYSEETDRLYAEMEKVGEFWDGVYDRLR